MPTMLLTSRCLRASVLYEYRKASTWRWPGYLTAEELRELSRQGDAAMEQLRKKFRIHCHI